jgi:hypothetical protein
MHSKLFSLCTFKLCAHMQSRLLNIIRIFLFFLVIFAKMRDESDEQNIPRHEHIRRTNVMFQKATATGRCVCSRKHRDRQDKAGACAQCVCWRRQQTRRVNKKRQSACVCVCARAASSCCCSTASRARAYTHIPPQQRHMHTARAHTYTS